MTLEQIKTEIKMLQQYPATRDRDLELERLYALLRAEQGDNEIMLTILEIERLEANGNFTLEKRSKLNELHNKLKNLQRERNLETSFSEMDLESLYSKRNLINTDIENIEKNIGAGFNRDINRTKLMSLHENLKNIDSEIENKLNGGL